MWLSRCGVYCLLFISGCFFFKQKTAYEMRISDWSSDVCSSDLNPAGRLRLLSHAPIVPPSGGQGGLPYAAICFRPRASGEPAPAAPCRVRAGAVHLLPRSEEHTSELQSLMRISYAVFCLKKKISFTCGVEDSNHYHAGRNTTTQSVPSIAN